MELEVEVEVGRQRCGPCEMWEFCSSPPSPQGSIRKPIVGESRALCPRGSPLTLRCCLGVVAGQADGRQRENHRLQGRHLHHDLQRGERRDRPARPAAQAGGGGDEQEKDCRELRYGMVLVGPSSWGSRSRWGRKWPPWMDGWTMNGWSNRQPTS